jgi:UDP-N-acetylmuramoyl-L-alanyl-D-glutamate--2,6-diaminopimelate ligase
MRLSQLIENLDVRAPDRQANPGDPEICAVTCRAQEATAGSLFVAIQGFAADGHDFIAQAVAQGAVAVVCEKPVQTEAVTIQVTNSRKALAEIASTFYGHPSRALTVIGITGTNGKTTTSYLIESVLQAAGFSTGVIGTINYHYGEKSFDNPVTTPESVDLQRIMAEMLTAGVSHVIMEVSSHALDLFRVHASKFDLGVFTNLTQDHLDYHKDMDHYWACKRRLFTDLLPASAGKTRLRAVINLDAPKGRELVGELRLPHLTCGQIPGSDLSALTARFDLNGIHARVVTPAGKLQIESPLVGRHNLENILAAVGAAVALEIPLEAVSAGIRALKNVPGRLERIPNRHGRHIYVDYAHTPDALENALLALRALTADRIICIFGCGGDRDRAKRPKMGAIAGRLSDLAVVTSDNPRTEVPEQIMAQIIEGLRRECPLGYTRQQIQAGFLDKGYVAIPDRREAIRTAVSASRPGDTLLIAGKGHEPYQIIGREKRSFDDRLEARSALAELL